MHYFKLFLNLPNKQQQQQQQRRRRQLCTGTSGTIISTAAPQRQRFDCFHLQCKFRLLRSPSGSALRWLTPELVLFYANLANIIGPFAAPFGRPTHRLNWSCRSGAPEPEPEPHHWRHPQRMIYLFITTALGPIPQFARQLAPSADHLSLSCPCGCRDSRRSINELSARTISDCRLQRN